MAMQRNVVLDLGTAGENVDLNNISQQHTPKIVKQLLNTPSTFCQFDFNLGNGICTPSNYVDRGQTMVNKQNA